jgi:hypothetical protein
MNMADRLLVVEMQNMTLYHSDIAKPKVFTAVFSPSHENP